MRSTLTLATLFLLSSAASAETPLESPAAHRIRAGLPADRGSQGREPSQSPSLTHECVSNTGP